MHFERELNVFLDLEVFRQTLKCRHPRYVLRAAQDNGTFPDLVWVWGVGVSAYSKSLVVKHKYSLGQVTKRK